MKVTIKEWSAVATWSRYRAAALDVEREAIVDDYNELTSTLCFSRRVRCCTQSLGRQRCRRRMRHLSKQF